MLGDLLSRLTDETTALKTVAGAGDSRLLVTAQEMAAAEGLGLGAYVTQAVQRYANEASNEEWATLMGLLNRAADPGAVCIRRALESALRE